MVKTPCFLHRGSQVQSLIGELRVPMSHGMAKKKIKINKITIRMIK